MKKTLLLIIWNFLLSSAIGQNYLDYYTLSNEADKEAYFGNNKLALNKLEQAFETVEYVHVEKLEKASKLAIKNKDFKKAYLYAKRAVINGSTSHFWKSRKLKKIRKTEYYRILNDSVQIWEQKHLKSINLPYKKIIDSLHYVDQKIIRKNLTVKGNYQINNKELPENLFDLDSSIFQTLLRAIEKYGFPSESNIGEEGYENVYIIFHHNVRLPENKSYVQMLEEALIKGKYRPQDFAFMHDQSRMNLGEFPIFYYGLPIPDTYTEEMKIEIDKSRKSFGIKPLSSTKIKRRGRNVIMKPLW